MENLSPEIIFQILLDSDYRDLTSYCLGNSNAYNICQDEYFWKQKLDKDYGGLRQYKPTNLTYQQQYVSLYNLPTLYQAINNSRFDQLMLLYNKGSVPDLRPLNTLVTKDDLEILKYYANKDILPDPTAYYYAAVNNRLNILDWLYSKGIEYPEEITFEDGLTRDFVEAITEVMGMNSVPILLWLEQHGIPITFLTANFAGFQGNIKLLEWLETNRNVLPDVDVANNSVGTGNIQLLEWLAVRNILPNRDGLLEGSRNLEGLNWITKYYEPAVDVANYALRYGNIEVLEWLASRNILPDPNAILRNSRNLKGLKWLNRYYEPTGEWAITPIQIRNIEILDWLLTRGIGYKEIAEWVKVNDRDYSTSLLKRYRRYILNRREEGRIY